MEEANPNSELVSARHITSHLTSLTAYLFLT